MKKVFLTLVLGLGLFAASCDGVKGDTKAEKAINIMNDAAAAIEKTNDPAEIEKIATEAEEKVKALDLTAEEEDSLQVNGDFQKAAQAFAEACAKKAGF